MMQAIMAMAHGPDRAFCGIETAVFGLAYRHVSPSHHRANLTSCCRFAVVRSQESVQRELPCPADLHAMQDRYPPLRKRKPAKPCFQALTL